MSKALISAISKGNKRLQELVARRSVDIALRIIVIGGVLVVAVFTEPLLSFLRKTLFGEGHQLVVDTIAAMMAIGFFLLSVPFLVWLERKISGHIQSRLGPMRVGAWHGWAQTIADGLKLFIKEDVVPTDSDKWLHRLGPVIVIMAAFGCLVVVPFGVALIPKDLNIGILYIIAVSSVTVFGIVIAGWGSNNKYSLLGGMRSAAQFVSYEIPRVLALLGIIMIAGSLQMGEIVKAQQTIPYIIYQPLGFILFFVASIAETNRVPFDLPEAESELVAGFHTEYSGMKFAFFFIGEYCNMLLACAICTALYLGGGNVPFIESLLPDWLGQFVHVPMFLIKTYLLVFVFLWVRWTLPRLRVDRLMDFSWKFLLPWSFANIIITGAVIVLIR